MWRFAGTKLPMQIMQVFIGGTRDGGKCVRNIKIVIIWYCRGNYRVAAGQQYRSYDPVG